jgi:hypothetical protein
MNYEIQVMHIISSRGRNSCKIIVTCVLSAYFFPFSQLPTPNSISPSPSPPPNHTSATLHNLHTPTPPLKHPLNQLPHPRTRLILLPRHRTVREPYLPTLQIHLRGTIEERPRDERLLGFGEGRRGVVFWWVRMDLD